MAKEIMTIEQAAANLPQKMQERRAQGLILNRNFVEGIRDAFPTLSIKGKVFRFRHQGVEQMALDENRRAVGYIDVVLVNASPYIAKTYYSKGYTEGDMDPPDCWSADSIKPDASVEVKVNPTCLNCPMNQFGSRITERGVKAKACADQRRIALTMDHQLDAEMPLVVLSRIPQGSLKNLKAYADHLDRFGIDISGVKTRLSFEAEAAFPKLVFEFAGMLTDEQYDKVLDLAEGEEVRVMLNAPIAEPADDNLDPSQIVRTPMRPAGRPQPPSNVMPLRPAPAQAQTTLPLATPAAQAAEANREAREEIHEQTGAEVPPPAQPAQASPASALKGPMGGLVDLGGGKFYNPITQALCDANGQPFGTTPASDAAPHPQAELPAAQAETQTWVPPQAEVPPQQPEPAAPAAAPGRRTRRAPAQPAADATPVSAAPPALEGILAKLMPKT